MRRDEDTQYEDYEDEVCGRSACVYNERLHPQEHLGGPGGGTGEEEEGGGGYRDGA